MLSCGGEKKFVCIKQRAGEVLKTGNKRKIERETLRFSPRNKWKETKREDGL